MPKAGNLNQRLRLLSFALCTIFFICSCSDKPWNDPNAPEPDGSMVYHSTFVSPPKHLDPALSYASDESLFLYQIYEPPMGYHFLKRPYVLEPLSLDSMPKEEYLDADGNSVASDSDSIAFTRYTMQLKPGLLFQPHPAFAVDEAGNPLYLFENASETRKFKSISDFASSHYRPIRANDFVYAIKRLADPKLDSGSPMLGFMGQYIVGMKEYTEQLSSIERNGWLNLDELPMEGLKVLDEQRYQITIHGRYPQFIYWMAMTFFSPVAPEVDRFYHNPGFKERNLTLDWWPVGSGPYMMTRNDPNSSIILETNPNFREDFYPNEGEASDKENGFLNDAGKRLPFIDKAIFNLEKSSLSMWTKFLQGYYDRSGETSANTKGAFDQAFEVGPDGLDLADELKDHGITMSEDVEPAVFYQGFNMLDPVVGGYTEEKRKLRRALQIAFNSEEFIAIFQKGNGLTGHSPIPPGIPGYIEGEAGINPYTHDWVDGKAQRKPIEHAKKLLAEAGYPNGRDAKTGSPLRLYFDVTSTSVSNATMNWTRRIFEQIGVQVEFRIADWNRTREKFVTGNTQIFQLGWLADYPDPENFLFLLYGEESPIACKCDGSNNSNYSNPEYDKLYLRMRAMSAGPERDALVQEMIKLYREDAVWLYTISPRDVYLNNPWVYNTKRHGIAKNTLKYIRLDPDMRNRLQKEWNKPVTWPLYVFALILVAVLSPAIIAYRRRLFAKAKEE